MNDSLELLKAALADRYRVEREIGSGGAATVYLAEDLRHHRKVAIKVLHPELAATFGPGRFLREIEVAAQLQHPNILALLDSGEAGGFLYYVMPYVDGPSLRKRILDEGHLPIHDAVKILGEVVDALAEAHRKGVVHRDVKPDNVMLTGRHALVTDFGVAKAVNEAMGRDKLTTAGIALGTPAYMAPEQSAADPCVDHRADIYAVGVMAYEMLTGSLPFAGSNTQAVVAAHMTAEPEPLRARRADIPSALEHVVLKCLGKQPADRWQSAEELLAQLEPFQTRGNGAQSKRVLAALGAAAAIVLLVASIGLPRFLLGNRTRWVHEKAIPEIERRVERGDWQAAYVLAKQATAAAPNDSMLAGLWSTFSRRVRIETDPPGAKVFRRAYAAVNDEWEELGTTPVQVRYPYDPSRLRFELTGYRELNLAVDVSDTVMRFKLDTPATLPEDMVRVTHWRTNVLGAAADLDDFFIDRYEVTNRQFKTFVDSGGYHRREFWEQPFRKDGRTLTWEEGVAQLTDRTGRPGPSTWEVGDYAPGKDDYPVSGISWYEAAAYARFVGKELPTVYHWRRAYGADAAAWIVPASNLESDNPARVGQYQGISRFGAVDMAGNVREWCINAKGDQRYILGGGWNDPDHLAGSTYSQPSFDRSPTNGFRLATYIGNNPQLDRARLPIPETVATDFLRVKPVPDDIFTIYRRMYTYDQAPLNVKMEETDSSTHWVRQRISFDAAYGHERMILYLYLPKGKRPPFQTVVYFPGAFALGYRSIDQWRIIHVDFVVKSGRAFAFPVYKATFERRDGLSTSAANGSSAYREHVLQWSKDLGRSLDYLETRSDIDSSKFAYYGYSWGGSVGPIMLAVEPRLKVGILYIAGIDRARAQPEVDPLNFLPRVKVPVVVLSGRFDDVFPLETSARPMFQLLGTPPERKRHVVSDGGHFVPRTQFIRETLDWLDRYLGPVR